MIKIIISHDVDHLFGKEHWFRDFIYPKLWIRSLLQFSKGDITAKELRLRIYSCVQENRHKIDSLIEYDKRYNVKSTFFFGMNQGLGMSYYPEEAKSVIEKVHNQGFSTGVHGINYQNISGMRDEFFRFKSLMGYEPDGIRMHYVRFDNKTFEKLASTGYAFDTTEFDKKNNGTIKNPYKIGNMWEFPLTIMDGYLSQKFNKAKEETLSVLSTCKERHIEYISILFHDYQFCDAYQEIRDWYVWLIQYFHKSDEYEFISYKEAIHELEQSLI